jgi:hypothetical protein
MFNLRELSALAPENPEREMLLRKVVSRFKDHPGLVAWKNVDEPAWGKQPLEPILQGYRVIKQLDPEHPVILNHAPRNTLEELRRYGAGCDGTGADIYPVSVPMGKHSLLANKGLSMVGDYTKKMVAVAEGQKPILMVLQITFSGTLPPKNILVRPTFEQQRYMAYQAIIDGANGLMWFGGYLALNERDQPLGFNWTYWQEVLGPLLAEIGPQSELYPVLTAPAKDNVKLRIEGAGDVEALARRVNGKTYILAAKREGPEAPVKLSGFQTVSRAAEVLFEHRQVSVAAGSLTDRFKPNAVHVYRVEDLGFYEIICPGIQVWHSKSY